MLYIQFVLIVFIGNVTAKPLEPTRIRASNEERSFRLRDRIRSPTPIEDKNPLIQHVRTYLGNKLGYLKFHSKLGHIVAFCCYHYIMD